MTRPRFALLLAGIAAALIIAPAYAKDRPGIPPTRDRALDLYAACWKAFHAECGRNKVDDGVLMKNGSARRATLPEVVTWSHRLHATLHPPTPVVAADPQESVAPSTPAPTSVAPAPAMTSGAGCSGMEAESGSDGYSAYNPSSGATGCYQILPSTAANYGCSLSTPGGQDACMESICADVGNSAWAASGATPCG